MESTEYLTIKQLAERLNMSYSNAYFLARSKKLRDIKGAVIDVSATGGKRENLRVDINKVINELTAEFTGQLKR